MNKSRRAKLDLAVAHLYTAKTIVETVSEEEEDCMNNLPDGISESDLYDKMERAVDSLSSAADSILEAIDSIEEAKV